MRIVGYAIIGPNEKYLTKSLDTFKLCDDVIILGNNLDDDSRTLINEYGYKIVDDNREWGVNQHRIKEDFLRNEVSKLNPDFTLCLDADEELLVNRETLEEWADKGQAWYVYVVNLWDDGYRSDWSFWNVRFWGWKWKDEIDDFFKFEQRPLHCGLAPKWTYHLNLHAPFMLIHYGLKDKEARERKVKRYEQYDPNQKYRHPSYYEALKSNHSEPFNREIIQDKLSTHIESIDQPLNKTLPRNKARKELLVQREADGFIFTIDEKLKDTQLKQKFKGKGFKIIE